MMRKYCIFLFCLEVSPSFSQNLIPNGDFEQYTICPNVYSMLERATYWINPTDGTPDYNHECGTSLSQGVDWTEIDANTRSKNYFQRDNPSFTWVDDGSLYRRLGATFDSRWNEYLLGGFTIGFQHLFSLTGDPFLW